MKNKLDVKPFDHDRPSQEEIDHKAHGIKDRGKKTCKVCMGHGAVYCCRSFELVMAAVLYEKGQEFMELSVLPYFPGTNMEMNHCPFCGRELQHVARRDYGTFEPQEELMGS